jgi:hypothetical protein
MLQLQEADNWKKPAATTWAAEFLLREGERISRFVDQLKCGTRGQEKTSQASFMCSFPCGKWLHMIGARANPGCELCKRERNMDLKTTDVLPTEAVQQQINLGFDDNQGCLGFYHPDEQPVCSKCCNLCYELCCLKKRSV